MPRGKKKCNNCSTLNYAFNKQCTSCGFMFGKKDGRPSNTKVSDGYSVGISGGICPVVPKPLMAILSV